MDNINGVKTAESRIQDAAEKLVAEQKTKKALDDEEKLNYYKNTFYYQQYLNYLNCIPELSKQIDEVIKQKYRYNEVVYRTPFPYAHNVDYAYFINIGFPASQQLINEFQNLLQEKMDEINSIDDTYYKVSVLPQEYVQDENSSGIYKKINTYQVKVEMKRKTLKK